jgi:hypothetical protein
MARQSAAARKDRYSQGYPFILRNGPKGGVGAIVRIASYVRSPRALLLFASLAAAAVLASAAPALAGQSSTGDLLFYPCTNCHPVAPGAAQAGRKLPNGFQGHEVTLAGHDVLGTGDAVCLVCHEPPTANPGMLKTVDGSLVDVRGDVSRVCFRCHSAKYAEWKAGIHGKRQPKCTSAGCHDPHTPGFIYAGPLLPFVGSGFQFRVRPARQPFMPLAAPAPHGIPPTETPAWFVIVAALGLVTVAGLTGVLVAGRSKR